jgi:hypothetical protein
MIVLMELLLRFTTDASSSTLSSTSRDPIQWPFCSQSIWNTPIGANAVYIDANIRPFRSFSEDVSHCPNTSQRSDRAVVQSSALGRSAV